MVVDIYMVLQEPCAQALSSDSIKGLDAQLNSLQQKAEQRLLDQVRSPSVP